MGKVQIKSYIKIGKKVFKGSPTDELRNDLTIDLGGTANISPINKIVLVDDADTERDSATISTTDWSLTDITGGRRATAIKDIQISANYSVAKIRLYTDSRLYFEYTLSTPEAVQSGGVFRVTITIDVTASITHSGGTLISISGETILADFILRRFTTGEYIGYTIDFLDIYYEGAFQLSLSPSRTVDPTNYRVTFSASMTPEAIVNMDEYRWRNSTADIDLITIKLQAVTLDTGVTHSWSLMIQL